MPEGTHSTSRVPRHKALRSRTGCRRASLASLTDLERNHTGLSALAPCTGAPISGCEFFQIQQRQTSNVWLLVFGLRQTLDFSSLVCARILDRSLSFCCTTSSQCSPRLPTKYLLPPGVTISPAETVTAVKALSSQPAAWGPNSAGSQTPVDVDKGLFLDLHNALFAWIAAECRGWIAGATH